MRTGRSTSSRSTRSRLATARRSGSAGAWPSAAPLCCSRPPASASPPPGPPGPPSAAGAAGAAVGGVAGHARGGMSRSDLKDLGETLDAGQAGLIVVYETNLADQVAANIKAANRGISRQTDMAADELAADMKRADAEMEKAKEAPPLPQQAARSPEAAETMTPTASE